LVTSSFRNGKLRPGFRKSNDQRCELVGSVASPIPIALMTLAAQ
jgi:hypothetical protein